MAPLGLQHGLHLRESMSGPCIRVSPVPQLPRKVRKDWAFESESDERDTLQLLQGAAKRDGVGGCISETLQEASQLLGDDFTHLCKTILEICNQAPDELASVCRHIVDSGGKYIRPILCLLAYRAVGGSDLPPTDMALTCELLHNATLLHDDVLDEGEKRRGKPTARVVYGNTLSVLGGDFLLVKTVEMVSLHGSSFIGPLTLTLKQLINGELVQLRCRDSIETTEAEYFHIIEGKTASLFRWAVHAGALAGTADEALVSALDQFGWNIGVAFQLMDDMLDITADATLLGKNFINDIKQGKMTLPFILAAREFPECKALLRAQFEGETSQVISQQILKLVTARGILDKVRSHAVALTDSGIKAITEAGTLDPVILRILMELSYALLKRRY